MPPTTFFEITPHAAPRREYIAYNKAVQTETSEQDLLKDSATSEKLDALQADECRLSAADWPHENFHSDRRQGVAAGKQHHKRFSNAAAVDIELRDQSRTLSIDEAEAVTSSVDFTSFVERSSKVIERALDNDYNILVDYSESVHDNISDGDHDVVSRSTGRSYSLRQTRQFFDNTQSRRRQISDLQFSPHFSEVVLSSHTKNPAATNEPSGLIMLWNIHAPSRPEYMFQSPGTDILSARFSPFHPNIIIGGCYGGQVCLWDTRAKGQPGGKAVLSTPRSTSYSGHSHPVYCINIVGTPNAHNIITASSDGVICSWNVDMLAQPQEIIGLTTPPPSKTDDLAPTCMSFPSTDPTFFIVGTEEGKIYSCQRYDRPGAKAGLDGQIVYQGHKAPVMSSHFHPARGPVDLGDLLLTSSVDWSIKLWRVKAGAASSQIQGATGSVDSNPGDFRGPHPAEPILDIKRDELIYDAKWAPHKPSVFACVTGAGVVEVFDLNVEMEIPVANASPTKRPGGALVNGLNKCAWEEKRGELIAVGGLDGVVSVFEAGKGASGEARSEEWTRFKKAVSRLEMGQW